MVLVHRLGVGDADYRASIVPTRLPAESLTTRCPAAPDVMVEVRRPWSSRTMMSPLDARSVVPVRLPCSSLSTCLPPLPGSMVPVRRPAASRSMSRPLTPSSIVPSRRPPLSRRTIVSPAPGVMVSKRLPAPSRTIKPSSACITPVKQSHTASAAPATRSPIVRCPMSCLRGRQRCHRLDIQIGRSSEEAIPSKHGAKHGGRAFRGLTHANRRRESSADHKETGNQQEPEIRLKSPATGIPTATSLPRSTQSALVPISGRTNTPSTCWTPHASSRWETSSETVASNARLRKFAASAKLPDTHKPRRG